MEIRSIETYDLAQAVRLALEEYQEECRACPQLIQEDFEKTLEDKLSEWFKTPYGKAAFEDGRMVGYLLFQGPWEGFFGEVKGAFSPLGGSAFRGSDRNRLASRLFEAAAIKLAEDEVFCMGVSRYAHADEANISFIMNGFGIRCSDAILDLESADQVNTGDYAFQIEELIGSEKRQVWHLKLDLVRHLADSPVFFPTPAAHIESWFSRDDIRVFAAKDGARMIGSMAFTGEGETFVSEHPKIANICMAYVDEAYRKTGAANQLLAHVLKVAKEAGMTHLGVDYETINPTALHFWTKHFEPYTYSYVRRLDERVLGYLAYLDQWAARQPEGR